MIEETSEYIWGKEREHPSDSLMLRPHRARERALYQKRQHAQRPWGRASLMRSSSRRQDKGEESKDAHVRDGVDGQVGARVARHLHMG